MPISCRSAIVDARAATIDAASATGGVSMVASERPP
jgi:hypothetical protein